MSASALSLFSMEIEARAEYEKAVILGDEDGMTWALHNAECVGCHYFNSGNPDVPGLLKSVPALTQAWLNGWKTGERWSDV